MQGALLRAEYISGRSVKLESLKEHDSCFFQIASGILFSAWDAHYRQISVLRFTNDGAALISGSSDSGVSVWSVSRLFLLSL